jgi:hypothetical protein
MQSSSARRLEPFEGQSRTPLSVQLLPQPPSVSEQRGEGTERTLTKARIEEAVGVAFIVTLLSLSGVFYCMLYQALRG